MPDNIHTSDHDWFEKTLDCYQHKTPFNFTDDRGLGISPADLRSAGALIRAVKQSPAITWQQVLSILTSVGMAGVGMWMINDAIADPEPTSQLGILLAGGVALVLLGGVSALWCLGVKWKISAKRGDTTITVEPR